MKLFCSLVPGHWPTPLSARRYGRYQVSRCWLCREEIVEVDGRWVTEREAPNSGVTP